MDIAFWLPRAGTSARCRAPGPRSYISARGERPARFSPEIWTRDEFGFRNLPEFHDIIREVVEWRQPQVRGLSPGDV